MSISIFITIFFNTAFVLLLANANLNESIPSLGSILNGPYNDYSTDWYKNVGDLIVISMIINAITPIIEFWIE